MSLYGSLFSGVTSLNAQSLALGDISENISNVNTVGFKASTTHFATLVSGGGDSDSVGGVKHISKQNVAGQGILQQTTNALDLGISGAGFFVVNDNVQGSEAIGTELLISRAATSVSIASRDGIAPTIGQSQICGSPSKYIWVIRRWANALPNIEKWMCAGRQSLIRFGQG